METTVVLVHGAFADAGSWAAATSRLQEAGLAVLAPANPLRDLEADAAYLVSILAGIDGPVLLAGHSYGGAVITNAALRSESVAGLVYIAAFALDEGESLADIGERFPAPLFAPALRPAGDGELVVDPGSFAAVFAADLHHAVTDVLAVSQRPITRTALAGRCGPPAWKSLPSWYLIAEDDQAIRSDAQHYMAQRAAAHTASVAASHAVTVSRPDAVAELIITAVERIAAPAP
ncbi:alpha/beta fold hydrolase [Nonomuraea sp. SYSU D8015]|uniref:alpha/beta fold hydrolase n=1 Tax=Nonomuraea sp. SYSU D8015 TaxID=2593644 RepID=UPI001660981B|nr:alpha/beta hydrolase [Nonomuraea sp. SYSU D8015]